jgi:ABC-2 type transport system permease protein
MMRVIRVTLREWSLFFKDRAAVLVLVVAGLFYAFYYPLPYLNQVARELPTGVVDHDQTPLSRQLVRYADATEQVLIAGHYSDIRSAEQAMANGEIYGVLEVPAGFEKDIRRGSSTTVGVYGHAGYFMVYSNIARGLSFAAGTIGAGVEIKRLQAKGYSEAVAKRIRDPLPVYIQSLYNSTGGYATYVVPGVLILILQQTMLIGIAILGGARSRRHLPLQHGQPESDQPLVVRWIGRGLAYLAHYLLFLGFYHAVVYPVFGFPSRGHLLPLLVFAVLLLSAVIQLGFLLSQFFKHRESAMQVFLYCSLPFLFATGFSWPEQVMPPGIRVLFWFVPSTHAVPAWIAIQQQGASLAEAVPRLVNLGVLALLYGSMGYVLMLRKERRLPK